MRHLIDQVDEAQAEVEASPAVRAASRLQTETGAEGVFRVVDRIVIPDDSAVEVTDHCWPNGEPVVVRRYWPKGDAQ